MKNKRQWVLLFMACITMLVVQLSGVSIGQAKNMDENFQTTYDEFKTNGRASLMVFSYEGECCDNTKLFLSAYNQDAKSLLSKYKEVCNTLYINIGILTESQNRDALKIARENKVNVLPSILILDKGGKVAKVLPGNFKKDEAINIVDTLLKDESKLPK